MKDKFFSIIGHDLRNPVNIMKGFIELLIESYHEIDDEKKLTYLGHISKTVDKTSDLLVDLLSWAKSQSGTLKTHPENINIHLLIQNTVALYKEHAAKKNIRYQIEPDAQHLIAYADKHMVETILRNLVSNAIKFSPGNSMIRVGCSTSGEDDKLLVWVKDQGKGLSPDLIPKLFRIDTNISTPGTEGETGTGLGLILCKEFVEKNNGKIWVESETDKGAAFYFTLPAGRS